MREHQSGNWSPGLTGAERDTLFAVVRDTLKWCVRRPRPEFSMSQYQLTPKLQTPMATFVTLRIGCRLRGCIGSLAPQAPLCRSVHENAINAAMHDPRFEPLSAGELEQVKTDISLLSPIVPLAGPDAFELGRQGIIMEKAGRRAVFLPEVPLQEGWTRDETLGHLCLKAGLAPDAWQAGAVFKVFESVVLAAD